MSTATAAEANLLPTVYFKKVTLESTGFRGVQTKHLQPTVAPGKCPHPLYFSQAASGLSADEMQHQILAGSKRYDVTDVTERVYEELKWAEYSSCPTSVQSTTGAEESKLRVSLELEVKFEFNNTELATAFLKEGFLSAIRIEIYRGTARDDGEHTSGPLGFNSSAAAPRLGDYIGNSININNFSPVQTSRGTVEITIPIGTRTGAASAMTGPALIDEIDGELPINLEYRAKCVLDTNYLDEIAGIDMENITIEGLTTVEKVLENSKVKRTRDIYIIDPSGYADIFRDIGQYAKIPFNAPRPEDRDQVWAGAVQYMPIKVTPIGGEELEASYWVTNLPSTESNSPYYMLLLKPRTIPNTKIVDYRLTDQILSVETTFTPATSIIDDLLNTTSCKGVAVPGTKLNTWFNNDSPYTADLPVHNMGLSCLKSRRVKMNNPEMYLSDAFISRDPRGNCRLLFNVDFEKIIRDKSAFGNLYTPDNKSRIQTFSSILNLRIVRRRVDIEPSYNRLGMPFEGREVNDFKLTAPAKEFIVESRDVGGILETVQAEGKGEIKETSSLILEDLVPINLGIRTFNISDLSFAYVANDGTVPTDYYTYGHKIKDGEGVTIKTPVLNQPTSPAGIYYQYGIELEIEDGSVRFLNEILNNSDPTRPGLKQIEAQLVNYYGILEQYINSKRHYNESNFPLVVDYISATGLDRTDYGTVADAAYFQIMRVAAMAAAKPPGGAEDADGAIYKAIYGVELGTTGGTLNLANTPALPWNSIPIALANLVASILSPSGGEDATALTSADLRDKFEALLIPSSTNPTLKTIGSVLSLVRNLIENVTKGLGVYLDSSDSFLSFESSGVSSSPKRAVITLNKYFYNIFDASVPHDTHLDILGEEYVEFGSIPRVTLAKFAQRADAEMELYFVSSNPENKISLETPYEDAMFDGLTDLQGSKHTFFSPANIKMGFDTPRLKTGLRLWDLSQPQTSHDTKGMDKYSAASAVAAALNTKDFPNHGGSSVDKAMAAGKHLMGKLGVKVISTPIPKILISNELDIEEGAYIPVAEILSPDDRQVRENLVGLASDTESDSSFHCDLEAQLLSGEKEFSTALPIVEAFVNNLGRNGAFVTRGKDGKIQNPHNIVASPLNKQSFDVMSSTNILEKMRRSAVNPKDASKELPGSWKAQYVDASPAVIEKYGGVSGLEEDLWADPTTQASMTWNYGVLGKVEVLMGYEKDGLGNLLLKKPIFKELGPEWLKVESLLNQDTDNNFMLCRISVAENSEIGMMAQTGLDLPILNEYFMLTHDGSAILRNISTPPDPVTSSPRAQSVEIPGASGGPDTSVPAIAVPYIPSDGGYPHSTPVAPYYGPSSGVQEASTGYTDYTQDYKPPGSS
jgi:hypothetical protein